MTLLFEPISLDRQHAYREMLGRTPWEASDYSFVNLWAWGPEYGLAWAWEDDRIWIRQSLPETVYWAPICRWETTDWPEAFARHFPEGADFIRMPEALIGHLKQAIPQRVTMTAAEEHWDYLYSASELIELKGNRFHKKKNLLNQFIRQYAFEYRPLEKALIREALGMQETWCVWRDCESEATLAAENRAIERVLGRWEELPGLMGGAIFVSGTMAAFTVAEAMNPAALLIHFEKGVAEYKGIYQAINQMFLAATPGYALINREPDMGEEGLRKAKRSYNPVDFVKKYRVRYTPDR